MAVGTLDELLAVLERSKLLKPEQLAEAQSLAKEAQDPTVLAKTLVRQGMLTRWQAGQLLVGRSTFFLGKYKLIELLGKGGMGSVFLGEHVMMNRRVALKIIPRHIGKDPAGLERFLAEARTIASLDHPNIVQAYSVDNESDLYYLVMEYVDGLDLQRLVEAEGRLDFASAVDYVRQAADGLAHAHARKMVHCDIKPSNLIVNPHGVVKILDMGLARLAGPEQLNGEASEQDERILGTVDYMAPEQALHTADFNHRADIYSLGCTLYFLLTGHAPFPTGTLPERILKHQTQQPPDISVERPDTPQSLIDICKKMMAKKPADRYQTAAEVSGVLAGWRPGEHRVKRVLTLKKAEPIDELPGPDVLGMDLSEMFRKGIGLSTTTPLKGRKGPETRSERIKAALRPLLSTPLRLIATISITAAALVMLVIGGVLLLGDKNPTVAQAEIGNRTAKRTEVPDTGQIPDSEKAKSDNHDNPKLNGAEAVSLAKEGPAPPAPPGPSEQNPPDMGSANAGPSSIPSPPPDEQAATTSQPQTPVVDNAQANTAQTEPDASEPAPVEPFKDLLKSVDLPDIGKSLSQSNLNNKTASLGNVVLPPGAVLQLGLIGGIKAVKGTDTISMQSMPGAAPPLWQISVEAAPKTDGDPPQMTEIAQLRLNGANLTFNWMPGATPAYAEALKKCGVLASVRGQQQFVQLCRPVVSKPLLLDFETNAAAANLHIDSLADVHDLFVQITEREGPFPENSLQPSDTLEVQSDDKNEIALVFSDPKFADFNLKITAEIGKSQKLDVKATAFYKIPGLQLKKFNAKDAERYLNDYTETQKRIQANYDKMPKGNPARAKAGEKLEQLKKQVDFLQDLSGLCQMLNKQGKLHYSVFILYGNTYKVELYTTQAPPPEPAAEPTASADAAQPAPPNSEGESQLSKKPAKKPAKKKTTTQKTPPPAEG
jgi:tRNA A-37 threonylcarbamoyl transferase component Bud32